MFSKKVEDFDALKQDLSVTEHHLNSVRIEATNLQDYKVKFDREHKHGQEMLQKNLSMNDILETQAQDYQHRIKEITDTKQTLIQENKGLRNQVNDAHQEIARLKQHLD